MPVYFVITNTIKNGLNGSRALYLRMYLGFIFPGVGYRTLTQFSNTNPPGTWFVMYGKRTGIANID